LNLGPLRAADIVALDTVDLALDAFSSFKAARTGLLTFFELAGGLLKSIFINENNKLNNLSSFPHDDSENEIS
jgi:hypothetical protein